MVFTEKANQKVSGIFRTIKFYGYPKSKFALFKHKNMFLRIIFILLSLLPALTSYSQIIKVKQDSTGDFTTIQAAINASANGDTVLVWPGTYYENINFNGHSITLASLNLTTGNPDYIHQTIIDGQYQGTCVMARSQENVTLQGFTIQHGKATNQPDFISGGGIFLGDGLNFHSMNLINCVVQNNYSRLYSGGIFAVNASLYLSGVSIINNLALFYAGGISVVGNYPLIFDTVNLCSIYNNYAPQGCDMVKAINTPMFQIPLDTISVSQPDQYNFYIINDPPINLNDYLTFQHYYTVSVNNNLYVNPSGDNNNSGLSADKPLKNIAFAMSKIISDSVHPDTIFLANGTYSKDETDEKFPIGFKSYISLIGENKDSTILDGCNFSSHFWCGKFFQKFYDVTIKNITFQNGNGNSSLFLANSSLVFSSTDNVNLQNINFINNLEFANALAVSSCSNFFVNNVLFKSNIGGTACRISSSYEYHEIPRLSDSVFLTNCIFQNNLPNSDSAIGYGGALITASIPNGDSLIVTVDNTLFADNKDDDGGYPGTVLGASDYGTNYFVNCTFVNDSAFNNSNSSNLGLGDRSKVYIYNSIMYHNFPWNIFLYADQYSLAQAFIYNSLLEGGISSIGRYNPSNNYFYYDPTNIDTDPLFYGGDEFPYNLSAESPCIDAGTLDLPSFINLPDKDLAGNPRVVNGKIDMGAYEWNPTVDVKHHELFKQSKNLIVAPNPFNGTTFITAHWNKTAKITIDIYNNNGLHVNTLQQSTTPPGSCSIPWDGTAGNGSILPGGVYIVTLSINGKETESEKVVKR